MRKIVVTLLLALCATAAFGQSKTVEDYRQQYEPDNALFFYKSTLRMFARLATDFANDPDQVPEDLPDLVDGIEKIKYFMYEYSSDQSEQFKTIKKGVESEGYESMMSLILKSQGNSSLEVFLKEKNEKPIGFVVLVKGEEGMQMMDIDGAIELNKVAKFAEYVSTSSGDFSWLNTFRDN